jgi:signal transduction histidine kinase
VILFYIFQEAITNITKHAQAKEIRVTILYELDRLTMRIRDNGSGITNIEPGKVNKKGSGLINMKNHAALISAELSINSNSSTGTEIVLQVPNPYE